MSLAEKINIDVKNALKAGDKKLLAVSRSVLSELKNLLIRENLPRDISCVLDDSFQKVIKTIVKQKNEAKEYLVQVNDLEKIDIIKWTEDLPTLISESLSPAEIQKVFKVSNTGKIAGSKVIDGEIRNKSKARIIRDGVVVYTGEIVTIFREKNQVKEVGTGLECGISLKDFIDFKEKDVIESYLAEKIQRSI